MAANIIINKWDKFSEWTIIKELPRYIQKCWDKKRQFLCKCKCGLEKPVRLSDLRSWKSTKCIDCSIKFNRWKNAANWKWWKCKIAQLIRNSKEYKDWRKKCFERDNYTCQISGQIWWELVVHHLKQFSIIVSDLEGEKSSDLLYDIDNWITITKELHNKFHSKYWSNNFTVEDFYEFKDTFNF